MSTIKIGFSRPSKWRLLAWVIMKVLRTRYDHVFVRIRSDTYERDIIYQASGLAVNFMSPTIFEKHNVVTDEFELPVRDFKGMMQWCIDTAGVPYGVKAFIGLGIVKLLAVFGKKIGNPFASGDETYICDKAAAKIMELYCGDDIPEDLDDLTPKDLYEYLVSSKAKRIK
jgi:hypothetical protein